MQLAVDPFRQGRTNPGGADQLLSGRTLQLAQPTEVLEQLAGFRRPQPLDAFENAGGAPLGP